MPDYKSMYFHLAGKVADAIELLTQAQVAAEEKYMEDNKLELRPFQDDAEEDAPPEIPL